METESIGCSQLYLITDKPIPSVRSEYFGLEEPDLPADKKILQGIFPGKYVYYLEPYTICGCGWRSHVERELWGDSERASFLQLEEVLYRIIGDHSVELFNVDGPDLDVVPESEYTITIKEFVDNIRQYHVRAGSRQARLFRLTR